MKVRYVRERGYKGKGIDPHFTIDRVYTAFGIGFRPGGRVPMVSIRCDSDGTPVILELPFFDIVDTRIPEDWVFEDCGEGYYTLRPKEFRGDFWDEYHDGNPEAEKIFEEVYARLCG